MTNARRSDFDVSNTVQVSSAPAVLAAVEELYGATWPETSLRPLRHAFEHFEELFAGLVPGYYGVDTVYHDRQHTLDITRALARRARDRRPHHRTLSRCGLSAAHARGHLAQRRRIHAHARRARRTLSRRVPAGRRARSVGADCIADPAL